MNKVTALLPMKEHSERVPNKNLKLFNGKPLYHSIVNQLILAKRINKIIVDTDSNNIIDDIKLNFKDIMVINRPEEIQGDFVSMNKIIEYDLTKSDGEYFIQTHSTNPLLKSVTIDKAIEQFFNNIQKHDSLFSVTRVQTRFYDKDINPINHNPKELKRTQDLDPYYEENSNFYIFSKSSFKSSNNERIGNKPNFYVMNKIESIDIDDENDFLIAESLKEKMDQNES
jgi:N-acylneuraminate cytidylyltransferase